MGIKLGAGAALDLCDGLVMGFCLAVGSVLRHGVIGVHHRQDTGQKGDVFALNAAGVAFSVPALMMA